MPDLGPPYRYAYMRRYSWAVTRTVTAQLRRTVTGDSACPTPIMVAQPATSSPGETDAAMPSHSLPHSSHIDDARPRPYRTQQLLTLLRIWQQRHRSRRQLAQLDSRLLADTGISEVERQVELSKPFWR